MNWYLYIVRCNDNSLYTGITTDTKRRVHEHNTSNAKGSKALRGKRPVTIVYSEIYSTKSAACKREAEIKKWNREDKLNLVKNLQKTIILH